MNAEKCLVEFLLDGPLSGLIGNRLFPVKLPQSKTLPAATYQLINRTPEHEHGDEIQYRHVFQIDIWGNSYAVVKQIADIIRIQLDGYRGPMGNMMESISFLRDERDDYDEKALLNRASMDFELWFKE